MMDKTIERTVHDHVVAMDLNIPNRSSKHELYWQKHCSHGENGYIIPTLHNVNQELFTLRKETFAGLPLCYGTYTNNDDGLWVAFGEVDMGDEVYVASKNVFADSTMLRSFMKEIR